MGKPKPPPAPDYSGVAAASAEAAKYSYQLGKEQLAWAKEQYASDKAVTDRVVDAAMKVQADNDAAAARDRQRYESVFQPLEDEYVSKARDYASEGRQDQNAGRAAADVTAQFGAARRNAQAQLEAYGVDPSQTRAAALDLGTRTAEAATRAGAANQARMQTEEAGNNMLANAVNIGKGYPGQIATGYGTGTAAGNQAIQGTLQTTASGANTMGTSTQYQGLGNQGLSAWTGALNGQANANNERFKLQQQSSSGIGSILGMGLGLATSAIPGSSLLGRLFEEGGAVPEQDEAYSHQGIPVTARMSPSGGADTDDIPARLNAGEFVLPEDTVRWFGEKHMQNLIEKARKERAEAPAKPKVQALPVERPVVRSSALPVG